MHREVVDAKPGDIVDHINHDRLDNRRSNLRICTHSQNCANGEGLRSHNSAGYKGVYAVRDKWRAQIRVNGRCHHLGYFVTKREAAIAYNEAAVRLFGPFASLNVIDDSALAIAV
jgi:hypothetical protein